VPIEELRKIEKQGQGTGQPTVPPVQFVPVPVAPPTTPQANPGVQPSANIQGASAR
jgi:hypothetical protein